MQFWHKFVSSQEKFDNDLIHVKVDSFLPQIAQFDKSINLFCLVFLKLEFSFSVYFL